MPFYAFLSCTVSFLSFRYSNDSFLYYYSIKISDTKVTVDNFQKNNLGKNGICEPVFKINIFIDVCQHNSASRKAKCAIQIFLKLGGTTAIMYFIDTSLKFDVSL